MHVNAEVIFYGGTDPRAKVTIDGKPIKLNPGWHVSVPLHLPRWCLRNSHRRGLSGWRRIPVRCLAIPTRHAKIGQGREHCAAAAGPSDGLCLLKEKPRPSRTRRRAADHGRPPRSTVHDSTSRARGMLRLTRRQATACPSRRSEPSDPASSWKDATVDDFRAFLFELMKSGRARSSIRLAFSALRSFYQFLVIRNILDSNVLKAVDIPKPGKEPPEVSYGVPDGDLPRKTVEDREAKAGSSLDGLPRRRRFLSSSIRAVSGSRNWCRLEVRASRSDQRNSSNIRKRVRRSGFARLDDRHSKAISRYRQKAGVHAGPLFISKLRRRLSARSDLALDEKISS